jgi:hypothetical protein
MSRDRIRGTTSACVGDPHGSIDILARAAFTSVNVQAFDTDLPETNLDVTVAQMVNNFSTFHGI